MTIKITKEDRRLQHTSANHRDGKRYALQGVHFNEKFAIATDGRALAIKRKTSTVDNKNIKFPTPYSATDVEYVDTMETNNSRNAIEILDGKFPDYKKTIQKAVKEKTKFRIRLDAEALFRLARALDSCTNKDKATYVEIDIPEDDKKPYVIRGSGPGLGLLMPTIGGPDRPAPRELLTRMTTEDPFLNFIDNELEGKFITQENQDGP